MQNRLESELSTPSVSPDLSKKKKRQYHGKPSPENQKLVEQAREEGFVDRLTPMQRIVVKYRYPDEEGVRSRSLKDIGENIMGRISKEAVRRLEERALGALKKNVRGFIDSNSPA